MLDDENWAKLKMFISLWSGDYRLLMKTSYISCNSYQYMRGDRSRVMSPSL